MARKPTIKQELRTLVDGRMGMGRSKHEDKQADKAYIEAAGAAFDKTQLLEKRYFYTYTTLENCFATSRNFVNWVTNSTDLTSGKRLDDIRDYAKFIPVYVEHLIEQGAHTPRTVAKVRSQLGKMWLIDTDGIKIPRCKSESMKGRSPDTHYNMASEKHAEATRFYECVGARKAEYHMLSQSEFNKYAPQVEREYGVQIRQNSAGMCPNVYPLLGEDGLVNRVIVIHAKHGKSNLSEILPENRQFVTDIYKGRNTDGYTRFVDFCHPSDHCNIHSCRRTYAQTL